MIEVNAFDDFVRLTSKLAVVTLEDGDDWWPTFKDSTTGEMKVLHHDSALRDPNIARNWANEFGRPSYYLALLVEGTLQVEAYDNETLSHSVGVNVKN